MSLDTGHHQKLGGVVNWMNYSAKDPVSSKTDQGRPEKYVGNGLLNAQDNCEGMT